MSTRDVHTFTVQTSVLAQVASLSELLLLHAQCLLINANHSAAIHAWPLLHCCVTPVWANPFTLHAVSSNDLCLQRLCTIAGTREWLASLTL